jgi:hypothetical protein
VSPVTFFSEANIRHSDPSKSYTQGRRDGTMVSQGNAGQCPARALSPRAGFFSVPSVAAWTLRVGGNWGNPFAWGCGGVNKSRPPRTGVQRRTPLSPSPRDPKIPSQPGGLHFRMGFRLSFRYFSWMCFQLFLIFVLVPPPPLPRGVPGEGPDCHFPKEIVGFGPIPAQILGFLIFILA